jgi:hypothetical protein
MKKKYNFLDDYILIYKIFFFIILVLIIINLIYAYATKKNKIITIKNSTYFRQSKYGYNLISDKDNNIYQVKNSIYYLFFNSAELYQQLEVNKTYNITYYGYRIPFLNMYPNIITATIINS